MEKPGRWQMSSTEKHIKRRSWGVSGYIELSGNTEDREFLGEKGWDFEGA